jgi:Mor family transcriptional regulator
MKPNLFVRSHKTLFEAFANGAAIADLAQEYGLSTANVESMLQAYGVVLLLPKSKAMLRRLLNAYIAGQTPTMNYEKLMKAMLYAHAHNLELPDWVGDAYHRLAVDFVGIPRVVGGDHGS